MSANVESEYSDYFVDSPFGDGAAKLGEAELNLFLKLKLAFTTIYSWNAKTKIKKVIQDYNIDVVYLLNICNYMTPSVIDGAKSVGVPVVMRLSDFNFTCSSYHYMREGKICTACKKNTLNAIKYKCVRGSFFQSLARVLAINAHRVLGMYKNVDAFVCPSKLMKRELVEFGIDEGRVNYLPSFVDANDFKPNYDNKGYALFLGRLSKEKGVNVLIEAWRILGDAAPMLHIVGSGELELAFKGLVTQYGLTNIIFKPFMAEAAVREEISQCSFVVIPSLCHDNAPMVAFESMASGKSIIASKVGGLVDQVVDGKTGLLVPPNNPQLLAEAVLVISKDSAATVAMGRLARERAESVFSSEQHITSLNKIFMNVTF